jgi:hypothetical protein
VLSETQRKNWNCLSSAQQDEFSNFSGASLARFKWANQQAPEFQIENTRTELKCNLPRLLTDGVFKRHNKREDHMKTVIVKWFSVRKNYGFIEL